MGSPSGATETRDPPSDWLGRIIELLRTRTNHDFTLYKSGTLERQIERRMTTAGIEAHDRDRYHTLLQSDPLELKALAKDLLINVTSFFRDRDVFALLADTIIPEMVSAHPQGPANSRLDCRMQHGGRNLFTGDAFLGSNLRGQP